MKIRVAQSMYIESMVSIAGAFGRRYYSDYVLGFNCTGSEITIANCTFEESGECDDRSSNYASVLCSKFPIDNTGSDRNRILFLQIHIYRAHPPMQ